MTDLQPGTPAVPDEDGLERAPGDPEHEALAASLPDEWVKAAESWYSMHGSGLVRNIVAGAVPLIQAAERERVRECLDAWEARYPAGGGMPEDLIADLRAIIGSEEGARPMLSITVPDLSPEEVGELRERLAAAVKGARDAV